MTERERSQRPNDPRNEGPNASQTATGEEPVPDDLDLPDDQEVRELVRRALSPEALSKDVPDLLGGVQKRIRRRSRGKFFADGWSTGQARLGYILIALSTLVLVLIAYYALGPMDVR
jgi:hypothetical protein